MAEQNNLSSTEIIKQKSDGLRGTIKESLQDELTGAIREDDQALVKFHGMYQQDDRDRREERAAKKLERLYSFMIRLRLPGGYLSAEQWIAMHDIAGKNATGTIKITTRQTIQLHGILKSRIKPTIKSFNAVKLDSIATCGDVNRNVLCSPHPAQSPAHHEVYSYARRISEYLKPKTHAYYEIWLDEAPLTDKSAETDPLYQDRYMPRKFKVGIAIPPNNDIDVLANDLGLIAIIEDNKLKGFNVAIGGGMGATHGNPATYPRLATEIGFVEAGEKTMKVIYEVATVQRDFGNRSDRKNARLKYTVDRMGVDRFKEEVEKRAGFKLEPAKPYRFTSRSDYYGWQKDVDGLWHYTVYIENGRVLDEGGLALKTALLEIAQTGKAGFRFTVNQNLILSDIKPADKAAIQALLEQYGIIAHTETAKPTRKNAVSCVALPTCPLALAESQRYFPSLLSKIELLLEQHGLQHQDMFIRMTGCPNGCARPHTAEIGFVGTAPGRYNLHIGGDQLGLRMNTLYRENLDEPAILEELDNLFGGYCREREKKESFGDYANRKLAVSV